MRKLLPLTLCLTLAAAGCARIAETRLNPFNWFGSSQATAPVDASGQVQPLVPAGAETQVVDARVLVSQVVSMEVARSPSGAIVRATGLAPAAGAFNAQLVPVRFDGGTLVLAFRVELPAAPVSGNRQVTAARLIPFDELATIRSVQVQGQQNARGSSR